MTDPLHPHAKAVLIVEDDEASQYIFTTILAHKGYRTLSAASAAAASRLLEENRVELVIMDIGLPLVDGFTLTRRIRENPVTRDVPILVITVHVFPEDVRRAEEAGSTAFMPKPVDPLLVAERVQQMIGPPLPDRLQTASELL